MDRFVRCDLNEFRAFVFEYAHHNPDQHHAIQSVLESLIQSKLRSSAHVNQQASDAPHSVSQSHTSPDLLDDLEPLCSTDQRCKDRNMPIDQRRDTRGRPSSIIVPDTVMPLSSTRAGEGAQVQRVSAGVEAGAINRTSPAAIERNVPTCPADQPSVDKHSRCDVGRRKKKRKLDSDAIAVPKPQESVLTIPASKPNGTSTCVQPHASDEGAVEAPAVPPDLLSKLSLIGSVEVLRDLKHTIFRLRSNSCQGLLPPSHGGDTSCISGPLDTLRLLQTTRLFSMLRNELEVTEIGEQLYRFRKRLALSQFFELYEFAQKNPLLFLQEDSETTQESPRNITSKQAPRLDSRVLNRIVDLMFPSTAHANEDTVTADGDSRRTYEQRQRTVAVRKIHDWRRNGKPWSAMVKRFGKGILLLLPKSLSDENLRTMKAATFEELLTTVESILSQSMVLLQSASALSYSLIRGQAPAETLRLEADDTLLDTDNEYSRQDLDSLLEPCSVVTPLGNSHRHALQVQKSSDNTTLGPLPSPVRSGQISTSQQIHPRDLRSSDNPTAYSSALISPARTGFASIYSDLSSPAKLPTPSFFNEAWLTTELRTPSIASPVW